MACYRRLSRLNLLMIFAGCLAGLFIGAMPGLGSVNGVAILLPVTLSGAANICHYLSCRTLLWGDVWRRGFLDYVGDTGGRLLPLRRCLTADPWHKKGMADQALMAAAIASFIGGTVSIVLFTLFAPPLANLALKFGPQEEFALMILAFATFIGLGGDDIPKTIFSILLGLVMAAVGFDIISGKPRMIFFDLVEFQRGHRVFGFLLLVSMASGEIAVDA